MKAKKKTPEKDQSTEERIKNAARIVFHQKGFAAARTRDIAQEAGINLALLNYYFRSKEKLFDLIMYETFHGFLQSMTGVFNDKETSLYGKIEILADRYIDLLIQQPEIPLFVLSEVRNDPDAFIAKMQMKELAFKSHFLVQFQQAVEEGKMPPIHPVQLLMNLVSLVIFPFIARPMMKNIGGLSDADFNMLMIQRKTLIPKWLKAIAETR
jgi:AcrR family transcriptional regulator